MASNRAGCPAAKRNKTGPSENTSDVAKIMEEFHCLYNERLKKLGSPCEGAYNQRETVLQEWVRDLTDQNRMLVRTVEHLEKNAVDRVDTLDTVLKTRAAEKIESQTCKDCPSMNERFQLLQAELDCARSSIAEKECMIKDCIKQNDDMSKALCAAQAKANNANCIESNNNAALEEAIIEYQNELCRLETALKSKAEEVEKLKRSLMEKETVMQSLKTEADKTKCIPKMQEAIGLLRDSVKEKDNILETYYQELTFLKDRANRVEEQENKLLQLEDNLKYYQQSIKQKDLMLDKLKEHIRQLRQAFAQNANPQDRGMISRSSSTEENYSNSIELGGSASYYVDEVVMAGGDSFLVEELKKKLANEKDMQVALTSEVAEKHDAIMRLKEHVRELEEQLRQSDMQTHFKDDIIRQLRKEVKLGRAKESLAEMLGLKGGPRAQMKAKIDNLHSELEEREIEISRLEGKLEASRLPAVEAKLNRVEVELVDRERSVLALCDKLDYVRKYLSKLRGSEEDISIKCGLEALLLELSEDVEWTREARRNVSIPINEDPKESVIIINHRSHSLPDTTLQKQVQSLKVNSECVMMYEYECKNVKEMSECWNLKEQITTLESGLSDTLSQLSTVWESMKKCELECGDSVMRLTQEVQNTVEKEHSELLQVNNEMQKIAERINELTVLGENNDYLLHCVEKCLTESLDILGKQKETMGFCESSLNSLLGETDVPPNIQSIINAEGNLNDAICIVQQLKTKLISKDASETELSASKTKEMNNVVNGIISSKQNVVDQLYLVHLTQEEIAKRIFKKFIDFDKIFGSHQKNVQGLKFVLNHFIFNDLVSKSSKQSIFDCKQNLESKAEGDNATVKELTVFSPGSGDPEANRIKALKKCRLSRSSPSIGEEYESDILGDIHVKSAHLQQIALSLNEEIKSYLKEMLLREDKVRRFVCESQDLNKTLDNLSKELCSSDKILTENKNNFSVDTLQVVIGQARTEVDMLMCKTEDFTTYKEMYDMNRSKMEQEIQALQKDMFTIVSDIMGAVKASQDYDNNLLNSYRNKIQNYREKVEQLEKHLTNSIDQNELEEKDDEEDIICKLSDKIEKYQSEVDQLRKSINIVKKDKETVEMENQKVMEELQAKICSLQAALQNETQQSQPDSQAVISRLGAIIKHQEEKIAKMHNYIKGQKEEYEKIFNQENGKSDLNKQEVDVLNEMLKQSQKEIQRLKSQVCTLISIKEKLETTIKSAIPEQDNEIKLMKLENIRLKKELEQVLNLNLTHCKDNENLRDILKQAQNDILIVHSKAIHQKEHLLRLVEKNKQLNIEKGNLESEKKQLIYEMSELKEELDLIRESECKISAQIVKHNQRICQLSHDKENLEKIIDHKNQVIQNMDKIMKELSAESARLKNDMQNPFHLEGQHLNDEGGKNQTSLEQSIDNLETQNFRLCSENLRLKTEINLLSNTSIDNSVASHLEQADSSKQPPNIASKMTMYRNKLKQFMHQNWRLIEMVNKLQNINNVLLNDKEYNKLKRTPGTNKDDLFTTQGYYKNNHPGGGEMTTFECY